jgi:Nif-specific regulatory protein
VVPEVSKSPEFLNVTGRLGHGEHSLVCVPIRVGQQVAGTLSADFHFDPNRNLDDDLSLLTVIAAIIAQNVKSAWTAEERNLTLRLENERLRAELKDKFKPSNIVGNSREMGIVYDHIAQISNSSATVLIHGETGTGKELVAQAIHYNSPRADKPFVKVHCAALTETIIESELFGHEKGAFTGATATRKGRFELAHGGTLFLDEIGDITPNIQIKLLRVLQEREFERVGGTQTIKTNVRLITATNKDLYKLCREGEFREDLYYRLHVFPIFVPPLRKRRTDISLLADYFLEKYSKEYSKDVKRISSAAIDMLYSYHWPGNVRELENIIERALLLTENEVLHPYHLPPTLQTANATGTAPKGCLKDMVERYEKDIIVDALKSSKGNITQASKALGSTQRILAYKVKNLSIDPKKYCR